jgi:hypothetical protein
MIVHIVVSARMACVYVQMATQVLTVLLLFDLTLAQQDNASTIVIIVESVEMEFVFVQLGMMKLIAHRFVNVQISALVKVCVSMVSANVLLDGLEMTAHKRWLCQLAM